MMLIRPAQPGDQDDIVALAKEAGTGLTTLPKKPELVAEKIAASCEAFGMSVDQAGPEYYLFVLEDTQTGKVVGTSALYAAVGLEEAFYSYKVGTVVHSSPSLGIYGRAKVLYLGNDFTGCSEIATLFLSRKNRGGNLGPLLSRSRFLFMAQFPDRFSDSVIAEMRGVSDEAGNSPFWDALGKKFFNMKFADADAISGLGENQFIAELMPKYPVYVNMLTPEARAVIGEVHDKTRPAVSMLTREGFRYEGYVDIFDAGPTLEVKKSEIRTLRKSRVLPTRVADKLPEGEDTFLVCNMEREGFRALLSQATRVQDHLVLPADTLDLLNINPGEPVRAVPVLT